MSACHGHIARSGEVCGGLCRCRGANIHWLRLATVRVGIVEDGKAIWTIAVASKTGHAWESLVSGQLRWLFGQHLSLALATLELSLLLLLLLLGLGSPSQHVGSSFSRFGA